MNIDFSKERYSAFEALSEAQKIAFAPFAFQTAWSLKELGILDALDQAGKEGATVELLAQQTRVSIYGVRVLLDMALSIGIAQRKQDNYILGKLGEMLLHDEMTRINMEFTQHVCYQGMFHLCDAVKSGKPSGLKELGDWPTIYPGLNFLPPKAKKAWHKFDHYYSDKAFPIVLPIVFRKQPKLIFDIGGNTGKWSLQCASYDENVQVTILDLPQQLEVATKNAADAGFDNRISGLPIDLLDPDSSIPGEADIYWMSQFLDCFSEDEIVSILKRIRKAMKPDAKVYIMELFWDRQKFEAASYSLNAISLYFTCLANGNSRFYESKTFLKLIEQSGFIVTEQFNEIGLDHTLLVCSPDNAKQI